MNITYVPIAKLEVVSNFNKVFALLSKALYGEGENLQLLRLSKLKNNLLK